MCTWLPVKTVRLLVFAQGVVAKKSHGVLQRADDSALLVLAGTTD